MKERRRDFILLPLPSLNRKKRKNGASPESSEQTGYQTKRIYLAFFGRQKYRRHTAGRIVRECGEAVRRLSETAEIDARRNQEAKCQLCVKHRTIQANP